MRKLNKLHYFVSFKLCSPKISTVTELRDRNMIKCKPTSNEICDLTFVDLIKKWRWFQNRAKWWEFWRKGRIFFLQLPCTIKEFNNRYVQCSVYTKFLLFPFFKLLCPDLLFFISTIWLIKDLHFQRKELFVGSSESFK